MRKLIIQEMLSLISREEDYDQLFADQLGVGVEYGIWKRQHPNMRLRLKYIIDTWETQTGTEATPQKMFEILTDSEDPQYKKILENLMM